MVHVPIPVPVTTPVAGSTVATVGSLLLHVPPGGVDDSVEVPPKQTVVPPVIAVGTGVTVNVAVA